MENAAVSKTVDAGSSPARVAIQGNMTMPKCDGMEVEPGIILIGEPTPVPGTMLMRCLANVFGMLAIVELRLKFPESPKVD